MTDSFTKHGFKIPGFQGEILKKVNDVFIGYVVQNSSTYPVKWTKNGVELTLKSSNFHLTATKNLSK